MPRESTTFKLFVRSTEGKKIALRADEFNVNFAEVCNGKALDDGSILTRHLDPNLIGAAGGIRSGKDTCTAVSGEKTVSFSGALLDANFSVTCTFESNQVGGLFIYIKSKTISGFTIGILDIGSNPVDCSVINIDFSWQVIKYT